MSATSRTNEAATRLREMFEGFADPDELHRDLDAALSEERRLTVERIRERLNTTDRPLQFQSAVWFSKIVGILDEIGGPMTPSQAAQEKHTSPRTPEERTPECDVCESPRPCLCDEYRAEAAASERSDPFVYYYETGDDQ